MNTSLPEAQGDGGGRPNQLGSGVSGMQRTPVSALPLCVSASKSSESVVFAFDVVVKHNWAKAQILFGTFAFLVN